MSISCVSPPEKVLEGVWGERRQEGGDGVGKREGRGGGGQRGEGVR